METIYIIGAGAIGKVLAVSLKLAGKNVILLRGSVDDGSRHMEKIQVTLPDKQQLEAWIEISSLCNYNTLDGIVILTNKSFGNEALAQILKEKNTSSPIIIMQNGLGIEQPFLDMDLPEVYRCVLFTTSQAITSNQLSFKPVDISPIGMIRGDATKLASLVEKVNSSYFRFRMEPEIQPIIWKKAIVNSVFNSICPLLDIDNGIFHRDAAALAIGKRVIKECLVIANENGIKLNIDEVVQSLLLISKASDGQLISTLQDIKKGRQTEIETLNFAIVKMAEKTGKETLVTETRLLGELTRLKSELSRLHA